MLSHLDTERWPPEFIAAVVNALLVLVLPFVCLTALSVFSPPHDVTARATIGSPFMRVLTAAVQVALLAVALAPFAALALWRTFVHARLYRLGEGSGWQGVLEAGAFGFIVVVCGMSWGITHRPAEAPAYITAYGGIALIIGLAVGLVLRTTGILVMKLIGVRATR